MPVKINEYQESTIVLEIFSDLSDKDSLSLFKELYLILDEYLDEQTDPDASFIEKLRDLLETTKDVSPYDFFQKIEKYAQSSEYKKGQCIQELLAIPDIGRFHKLFRGVDSLEKEPLKDKIRHHLRELSPSYFNPLGRENAENRDELVQVMIAKLNNSLMPNFHGYFVDAQKYIMSPKQADETFLAHRERINKELFEEINHVVETSPDNRLQIIVRTARII